MSSPEPVKDETSQRPVREVWRPTIAQVVRRFVAGDFELAWEQWQIVRATM